MKNKESAELIPFSFLRFCYSKGMKKRVLFLVGMLIPSIVSAGPLTTAQPIATSLTNILDFLLSIVGVLAIIGLVIAGGMYVFAAGDMRQISLAKKTFVASITGLLLALGSYVIIRTLGDFIS